MACRVVGRLCPQRSFDQDETSDRANRTDGDGNDRPEVEIRSGYTDLVTALGTFASRVVERLGSTLIPTRFTFQLFPLTAHGTLTGSVVFGEVAIAFATGVNRTILPMRELNCWCQPPSTLVYLATRRPDIPIAVGADPFVRRPSEAVCDGFDGLGGPSYGISKCAILSCELYSSNLCRNLEVPSTNLPIVRPVVQMSIFRPDDQIRSPIAIPIDHRWTGGVARESCLVDRAFVLELPRVFLCRDVT